MVSTTLVDAVRRARMSWRGQLLVLAAGSVLLGLTLLGGTEFGDVRLRAMVGAVETLLLVAASIRMALLAEAGYDGEPLDVGHDVLVDAPRLFAQVGAVLAVPVVVAWVALGATSLMTVAGLVAVPLAFTACVFAGGPALLATCAVVLGDRDWLPRSTWNSMRGWHVRTAMVVLAGGVATALACVPFLLLGFVVNAVGGMLGIVALGLGASAAIPWMGCGALATWRAIGASIQEPVRAEGLHDDVAPQVAAAFQQTTWMEGPAWDVAVEAGAVWGTWIRLEAASVVGIRVSWHAGDAPELAFASEAGTWTRPGAFGVSGGVVQASLPAGSTYLQLTSTCAAPQALSVAMLVPPAVAA